MVNVASVNWTAVGSIGTLATVVIYVALGIFAWIQVLQARRLREEQARPFVIVDFEPGFLIYLTLENIGKTMARNVKIEFDKRLESSLQGPREIDETPIFRRPIPSLPPEKKIRVLFDSFTDRINAKLPLSYEVILTYQGATRSSVFRDVYQLDLETYRGSQMPQKGIPELVAEVEGLREEIKKWRGGELQGILVHNLDQRREDKTSRRRRNMYILRRKGFLAWARTQWQDALARRGLL
jgi:hypothetical protein